MIIHGSTRTVILIGPVAIKIPSLTSWANFKEGLRRNLREDSFANHRDCPCPSSLCPVLSVLPRGLLNLMPKARPLTDAEWEQVRPRLATGPTFMRELTGSRKDSFGRLPNGRLVAVDYGEPTERTSYSTILSISDE